MPKPAKKSLEHTIDRNTDKKLRKAQLQEIVNFMSCSLESTDRKIEEIKTLLDKNCVKQEA